MKSFRMNCCATYTLLQSHTIVAYFACFTFIVAYCCVVFDHTLCHRAPNYLVSVALTGQCHEVTVACGDRKTLVPNTKHCCVSF